MRRERRRLFLIGGAMTAMLTLALVVVSQSAHGAVSFTGTVYPTRSGAPASCTPTPAVRPPTFTIGPGEGAHVNIQSTKIVAYRDAYPGGVIIPARTTDLAPTAVSDEKYGAVVRHINCTYDKYLLLYDQLAAFENNLPPGDQVVAVLPPSSSLGHVPNTVPPLGPGTRYPVSTGSSPVHTLAPPPLSVQQTVGSKIGPIPYDATRASLTHTTPVATP